MKACVVVEGDGTDQRVFFGQNRRFFEQLLGRAKRAWKENSTISKQEIDVNERMTNGKKLWNVHYDVDKA
jgi:hypothetical protein